MQIRFGELVIASALLSFFAPSAAAQPAFELQVVTPNELRVAPGQSITHALRIRNVGNAAGPLRLLGHLNLMNRISNWPYTFGPSSNQRCGTVPAVLEDLVDLTTDTLAAGETLECEWVVQRPLQSNFDAHLRWHAGTGPSSSTDLTLIGTLTNTSVSARTRSFRVDAQGFGHATIELGVHNGGPSVLEAQQAYICGPGQIVAGGNMAGGGCGAATATACGAGYAIPSLSPGQTFHCNFDVRTQSAYVAPIHDQIRVAWEQGSSAGLLLDTHEADNAAAFVLGPAGDPPAPVTLNAIDRTTGLLLFALLGGMAMLALPGRRRQAPVNENRPG
jgi:hypothetical protein